MGADHLHAVLSSSLRMLLSDLQLVAVTTTSREDSDEVTVIVRGRPQPRLTARLGTPIEEARAALSSPPEPVEPPPWVRPSASPATGQERAVVEDDHPTTFIEPKPTPPGALYPPPDEEVDRIVAQLGPTEEEQAQDPFRRLDSGRRRADAEWDETVRRRVE